MRSALPARTRAGNPSRAVEAPCALALVATFADGPDCCHVLLCGEVSGPFDRCRRHAMIVLDALAAKYGRGVDVQLLDGSNAPIFAATAGGAA